MYTFLKIPNETNLKMKFIHVHTKACCGNKDFCLHLETVARGVVKDKNSLTAKAEFVFERAEHFSKEQINDFNMYHASREKKT